MTFSDKKETVKNELTLKEQLINVIQEEKKWPEKEDVSSKKKCEKENVNFW